MFDDHPSEKFFNLPQVSKKSDVQRRNRVEKMASMNGIQIYTNTNTHKNTHTNTNTKVTTMNEKQICTNTKTSTKVTTMN